MKFNTIQSLGSRCQNSEILKHYNYREFSGFFDFMNTRVVKNLIHILADEFKEILNHKNNYSIMCNQLTIDPETGNKLPTSIRTSNSYYDIDPTDVHNAIFPHHDLNTEKDYNHFVKCRNRFKALKHCSVLFNYTYNTWENKPSIEDMELIVKILKNIYKFTNFKVCFIGVHKGDVSDLIVSQRSEYYDIWSLTISNNSFTGGLFSKPKDNENYINIIKSYDIDDIIISKEKIDNYEF
mgnify:FL=1|tara:strand:+ start:89 stop:802 length:714 start_codon:yes stop_codon:yes gene_type:complete